MKNRILTGLILLSLTTLLTGCRTSTPVGDVSKNIVICLPGEATPVQSLAASELALHLKTVLKIDAPIVYVNDASTSFDGTVFPFYIGFAPPGTALPAPGHGGYKVTAADGYFYGNDVMVEHENLNSVVRALHPEGRPGTAFALYQYLEKDCGIRWPEPKIIFYPAELTSGFPSGSGTFVPLEKGQWVEAARGADTASLLPKGLRSTLALDSVRDGVRQLHNNLWMKRLRLSLLPGVEHSDVLFDAWCPGSARTLYGTMATLTDAPARNLLLKGRLLDWGLAGLMRYTLAQGMATGFEEDFSDFAEDYFRSFGPAEDDVRSYYQEWEGVYDRAAAANLLHFAALPGIVSLADLNKMTKWLDQAVLRPGLSDSAKQQLDRLVVGHEHTIMMLETHEALKDATVESLPAALERVQHLIATRGQLKTLVLTDFVRLTETEVASMDLAGVRFALLADGLTPSTKVADWRMKQESLDASNGSVSIDELMNWEVLEDVERGSFGASIIYGTAVETSVPDRLRDHAVLLVWGMESGTKVFLNGVELSSQQDNPAGSARFAIPASAFTDAGRQVLVLAPPSDARVRPCRDAWFMTESK